MKILVIGSCGAGKSTVAKTISSKLGIPLIGLDQYYWKPGWKKPSSKEWRAKVSQLVKKKAWVMDGNYLNTFDIRFPASDAIVIVDVNRFVCLWRILKRRILQNRPDKLDQCPEKVGIQFILWVLWGYPTKGKREIQKYTERYPNKKIITVRTNKDVDRVYQQLT